MFLGTNNREGAGNSEAPHLVVPECRVIGDDPMIGWGDGEGLKVSRWSSPGNEVFLCLWRQNFQVLEYGDLFECLHPARHGWAHRHLGHVRLLAPGVVWLHYAKRIDMNEEWRKVKWRTFEVLTFWLRQVNCELKNQMPFYFGIALCILLVVLWDINFSV